MGNKKGFTLVEILITITLMGALLAIAGLNFNTWQKKSNIDGQVKEMLADFAEARMTAIHRKSNVMIALDSNQYVFRIYTTNEVVGRSTGRSIFTKTLKYPILKSGDIGLNGRGFTEDFVVGGGFVSNQTISVPSSGVNPAVDCLVVSTTRVNIGRMNGINCEYK